MSHRASRIDCDAFINVISACGRTVSELKVVVVRYGLSVGGRQLYLITYRQVVKKAVSSSLLGRLRRRRSGTDLR